MIRLRHIALITLAVLLVIGCSRGRIKEKPPIHLNPNMDTQQKYKPFRSSDFFVDGSTMRQPVEGTVARGELMADEVYYTGKTGPDMFTGKSPVHFDELLLRRGQERFNIYCTPCHGINGDGKGKIMEYKYPIPPTSMHDERILKVEDGYLFHVISNGIRNMPPYDHQIPVADRWAIVGHIRELQAGRSE